MISLEDFHEYMSQHGKSENTIKTYLGHVKGYALWLAYHKLIQCTQLA